MTLSTFEQSGIFLSALQVEHLAVYRMLKPGQLPRPTNMLKLAGRIDLPVFICSLSVKDITLPSGSFYTAS